MERNQQFHVVVLPYPGQGHINPAMQLSIRLASLKGLLVTFVTCHGNHKSITETWSRQGSTPPLDNLRMASISDDVLPPRSMQGIFQFFQGLKKLRQPFEDFLIDLKNDPTCPPVACIISDSLVSTWVLDVAHKFSIRWVPYFPSPVTLFLVLQHAAKGLLPVKGDDAKDDELIEIPGLVSLRPSDLPTLVTNPEDAKHAVSQSIIWDAKHAPCILINTCEALEHEALEVARRAGFNFIPVAPLVPSDFVERKTLDRDFRTSSLWQQDGTCLEWLDKQASSSVLYVSFGSIAGMVFEDVETILEGILSSGMRFLWVLRPDLVTGLTEEKYQDFLKNATIHGQGLVVRWAPQLQVLLHPAVAVFLTHCGWNSTFESIYAELPMICWPCFAEQKLNCKYIVDVWKIGVEVARKRTSLDVEKVVVDMMKGETGKNMKARVLELSKACKDEHQTGNGVEDFGRFLLSGAFD